MIAAAGVTHAEIVAHLVRSQFDTPGPAADLIGSPPGPGIVANSVTRTLGAPAPDGAYTGNRATGAIVGENDDDAAEVGVVQRRISGGVGGLACRGRVIGVGAVVIGAVGVVLGKQIRTDDRDGAGSGRIDPGLSVGVLSPVVAD